MSSVIGGLSCGNGSGCSCIEVVIEVAADVAVAVVGGEVKFFDSDRRIRVMGSHIISLLAKIIKKRE